MRCLLVCCFATSLIAQVNWPQWRGPLGTGVAPKADPPIHWSENDNLRWRIEIPGLGHSSPVVWGDTIFITSAIPVGEIIPASVPNRPGAHDNLPVQQRQRFVVLAIDRKDGRVIWQKTVAEELPHEGGHITSSFASASPVTNGEQLFAFFGSYGLYALDLDGNLLWSKDLGNMHSKHGHGEGSSPVLYQDTLVVNWDHEGDSFVVAFHAGSGQQKWKVKRNEATSWATPLVIEKPLQVVVAGTERIRGYDLNSGAVLWSCGGLSANVVATPVYGDGVLLVGSSYEKRALLAIRLPGASGDISGSDRVLWTRTRGTPYVPSLLLYEDSLYFLTHYQGVISRVDALTGNDRPGSFRLGSLRNIYASPVAAAGRVYVVDLEGQTLVMSHSDQPQVLALNRLDDSFSASPALVERDLILRGRQWLYCISEPAQ